MGQVAVAIPEKIYFKIGEVCDIVGVQAHVLRYWETEFPQLAPQKNRSGQRSYRRKDVETSLRIKELLYEDLYTIAGARKKLQTEQKEAPKLKIVHPEPNILDDREIARDEKTQSLFDEDEFDEIHISDEPINKYEASSSMETDEAFKNLASHLLELRELLSKKH